MKNIIDKEYITFMNGVSIGRSGQVGGRSVTVESVQDINYDYKRIIRNNEQDNLLALYEINTAIMNFFAGESELSFNMLKEVDYINDQELEVYKQTSLAAMYIELSRFEEAEKIIMNNMDYKEYGL